MLTRYAIFEGRVRPGMDSEMRDYVNNVLAPLWRQFDGARTVRVMFGVEQDPNGPSFPLVLAITYPDAEAMARGLASPARYESRELLPEFFAKYIDRKMLNYIMKTGILGPNKNKKLAIIRLLLLATTAVTGDPLIGHPCASWHLAILPKHINRHTATRVPVAAHAQPAWGQQINKLFANANRASLMK